MNTVYEISISEYVNLVFSGRRSHMANTCSRPPRPGFAVSVFWRGGAVNRRSGGFEKRKELF
ncbi:hypothetical protein HMPREF1631_02665 [Arcanobacterium sp. S3PF19]|nr:hypothetical protein HMPREF1631_02665 [Arcanobacterium sp. S3PF19]